MSLEQLLKNKPDLTHAELMEYFKGDLIILLLTRLGGEVTISVEEFDTIPAGLLMAFQLVDTDSKAAFRFLLQRKV